MAKLENSHIKCVVINPEFLHNNKKLSKALLKLFSKNLTQDEINKVIKNLQK